MVQQTESRSPHGERGLKYIRKVDVDPVDVAPLTGSVD